MKSFEKVREAGAQYARHHSSRDATYSGAMLQEVLNQAYVEGYRQAMADLANELGLPPSGGWK